MAVPAAQTLVKIEDTRDTEMTVKITGYQWKWHYEYVGEDYGFYSSLSRQSNAARRLIPASTYSRSTTICST